MDKDLVGLLREDIEWLLGETSRRSGEWWGGVRRNLWLAEQHLRFVEGERGKEHALYAVGRVVDALTLIMERK